MLVRQPLGPGVNDRIREGAVAGDWHPLLRDLIAGGHVGVEVVFALEEGEGVYVAVEGESGEEGRFATPAVEGGHGAGQRGVEEGRARVRRPVDGPKTNKRAIKCV